MKEPPIGIDTLRLRGRLRDADAVRLMSSVSMRQRTDVTTGETRHEPVAAGDVLRSGARIGVDKLHGGAWEGWVEFSAPKIATGSNVVALPLGQAVEVAWDVCREAEGIVSWLDPFERMRVQRVDPVRDFEGVEHQVPLLTGLSKLRAAYNPKTRLFPDPAKAGAMTLTRGPATRWQSTLYDKEGEARHRARYAPEAEKAQRQRDITSAAGRLRFEARLRSDVLEDQRTIADLTEAGLAGLRRKYFERVGYGMEVAGMDRAVALVAVSNMTEVAKLQTLGYLLAESQGLPVHFGRTTVWKYRKRCEELGVTAADMASLATTSVRLDYEAGAVVAA